MRLILAGFILIVAALHFFYGLPQPVLEIAALAAGLLLSLTVVIDHLTGSSTARTAAPGDGEASDAGPGRPQEPG